MPKPQLVSLGSLLTGIDAGHSPNAEDIPAGSGEWGVLKVSAVGADGFHPHENKVVREQRLHKAALRVRAGDLLITRANTAQLVGLACIAEDTTAELMLSDKTLRLSVNKRVAPVKYVQAALGAPIVRRQIENLATGTSGSMKNISQRSIQSLMIPFSGTEDAVRIAEILDSADEQIRATEAALRKLTALKSGIIRAAFDGMPQATERSTVGSFFSIKSGITLGPHRLPGEKASKYLRVANVQRARIDLSDVALLQASTAEKAELQLAIGDLLVVEGHANPDEIGRCALVDSDAVGLLYQNHLFRLRSAKVVAEFAELWLNSDEARAYWQSMTATSSGLYTINSRMLRQMPFPTLAPKDQADVVNAQRLVANTVKVLHEELDKLRLVKRGLMDDLLTGRMRIPTLHLAS